MNLEFRKAPYTSLLLMVAATDTLPAATPEQAAYQFGRGCGYLLVIGIGIWLLLKVFKLIGSFFRR